MMVGVSVRVAAPDGCVGARVPMVRGRVRARVRVRRGGEGDGDGEG